MRRMLGAATLGALAAVGLLPAQGTWRPLPELKKRNGHASAYDPVRRRVVLFGGITGRVTGKHAHLLADDAALTDDTWEWDGRRWRYRRPRTSPSVRRGHAMAWDPVGKRILLFGGASGRTHFNDTWAWDGQDWRRLAPRNAPKPRLLHTMTTDPIRKRIVLFGGMLGWSGGRYSQNDTWEWDGTNWIPRNPPVRPYRRNAHGAAFCMLSRRVVVFGGNDEGVLSPTDRYTWEWDGKTWTRHDPAASGFPAPMSRSGSMGAVPSSGGVLWEVISFDYQKRNVIRAYSEDWTWDGQRWRQLPIDWARSTAGVELVADDARSEVVAVNGFSGGHLPIVRDTWVWNGSVWRKAAHWGGPDDGWQPALGLALEIVHDAARDQVLFVGGSGASKKMETWAVDRDYGWKKLQPASSPPQRHTYIGLVYHAGLKKVFLHGGRTPNLQWLSDTWLWDGRTWTDVTGSTRPILLSIAYDSRRAKVMGLGRNRDTWEWTPKGGWLRRTTAHQPPKYGWRLAYDVGRDRLVCVSPPPLVRRGPGLNEVWEWNGQDWRQVIPKVQLPPRDLYGLVYCPPLGGVITIGGQLGGSFHASYNDTWLWDGQTWTKLNTSPPPSSWEFMFTPYQATYDSSRQRVVAAYPVRGQPGRGTVWEYFLESLRTTQPYPRPGQSLSLDITLPAQAGNWAVYALSRAGWPGIPLRPVPGVGTEVLPLAPDSLLWTTLSGGLIRRLDSRGKATLPLIFPRDQGLVGLELHAAAFTLDPQAAIGAITNRVQLEVVR